MLAQEPGARARSVQPLLTFLHFVVEAAERPYLPPIEPCIFPVVVDGAVAIEAGEIAAVLVSIWVCWHYSWGWWILLLAPFSLALVHQLCEWAVRVVVETARSKVRGQRMGLVAKHLTTPLSAWLAELPITEGTSLERLNQVLARVPGLIRDLAIAVKPGAA